MARSFRLFGAALAAAAIVCAPQDPPPAPPAAPPAPPAAESPTRVVGTPARHELEGVYELRARIVEGKKATVPSTGWLAITRRHLFLCLAAPGADPDSPLLRAGVRTWHQQPEGVQTVVQLGWFTDKDGTLHLERAGTAERRRIELVRGGVRVAQDERNWLDFERIE